MAFFKLEDFTGSMEALAFADAYEKCRTNIQKDAVVMVIGKLNTREGEAAKILVDEVIALDDARSRFTKSLCVVMSLPKTTAEVLNDIKSILEHHTGTVPVYFRLQTGDNGDYFLRSRSIKVKPSLKLLDALRDKVGRENVWVGA